MNLKKVGVLFLSRWMLLIVSLAVMTLGQTAQAEAEVVEVLIWFANTRTGIAPTHGVVAQGNGSFTTVSPNQAVVAANGAPGATVTAVTPNGQGGFNPHVVRPGVPAPGPVAGPVAAAAGSVTLGGAAFTAGVAVAALIAAGAVCIGLEDSDQNAFCTKTALSASDEVGLDPIDDFKFADDAVNWANRQLNDFGDLFN